MSFYAYIHCKPDGTPFYVGKGSQKRAKSTNRNHNPGHTTIVAEFGADKILVGALECSDEETAFSLERGLIKRLRKMGISIVNLTDGGDGVSGHLKSEETRKKMSAAQMGNKKSLGAVRTPETRQKMAASKVGNSWNCGRTYSQQTRRKKSRSLGGSWVECTDGVRIMRFYSIAEAASALDLNPANVTHHLNRTGARRSNGVKGWVFRRISE